MNKNSSNNHQYDKNKQLYQNEEYANRYKAEYTSGWRFIAVRSRLVAHREIAIIKRLLDSLVEEGMTILDLPCGTGKLGKLFSTYPVNIVAADASEAMMKLAVGEYKYGQVSFEKQDVTNITIKPQSVDIIVSLRLFQRLPKDVRLKALDEYRRVSNKYLIISYSLASPWQKTRKALRTLYDKTNPSFFHVGKKNIIAELRNAGFKVTKISYVIPLCSSEVIICAEKIDENG